MMGAGTVPCPMLGFFVFPSHASAAIRSTAEPSAPLAQRHPCCS